MKQFSSEKNISLNKSAVGKLSRSTNKLLITESTFENSFY